MSTKTVIATNNCRELMEKLWRRLRSPMGLLVHRDTHCADRVSESYHLKLSVQWAKKGA